MTRRTRGWIVVTMTIVAFLGILTLTPQYKTSIQLWGWMQRYPSGDAARAALMQNPNDARAYRTLVWEMMRVESRPGEKRRARLQRFVAGWEKVVQCDPTDEFAQTMVAQFAAQLGDLNRARRILEPIAAHGNLKWPRKRWRCSETSTIRTAFITNKLTK